MEGYGGETNQLDDGGIDTCEEIAKNVAQVNQFMASWLADNQHIHTLILDLRFNNGGYDEVALEWVKWLVNEQKTVMNIQARWGDNLTADNFIDLIPYANAFQGEVIVLTSKNTVSEAEVFLLVQQQYDKTVVIGEPTQGAFSNILEKFLPNGFKFSLSNEKYTTATGEWFEGIGLAVDDEIPVFNEDDLNQGTDLVLKRAIELAQGNGG